MTGETKSSLDLQLDEFLDKLNDYITQLGLGNVQYSSEVERALSFSATELRGLTSEECGIYASKLQQFAFYLQMQYNRNKNVARWINQNLTKVIASEGSNYGDSFTKYETIKASVVVNNSYASALEKLHDEFYSKQEELDFLANRVSAMAKTLSDLQYTKRFNRD